MHAEVTLAATPPMSASSQRKDTDAPASLARVVGLWGAVWMGLGSILGTGVFVRLGIATGVVGSGVVLAVALAALVTTANGLSSAQLAAAHPVSGGTYEYGHRFVHPAAGFARGRCSWPPRARPRPPPRWAAPAICCTLVYYGLTTSPRCACRPKRAASRARSRWPDS